MTYTRHPALTFALVVVAALLGVALMHIGIAAADTGGDTPSLPAWYRDPAILTSGVVLAAYGLIAGVQKLGRLRWRWTAWLRVKRVQAHLAGFAAALYLLIPAAIDGTLAPRAAVSGLLSWLLLRSMPGGGEERPGKVASGEVETQP